MKVQTPSMSPKATLSIKFGSPAMLNVVKW